MLPFQVTQMSKIGGSNTYDFAKRVLQSVMTNELANLYSWLGRREKLNFCQLPFAQLVMGNSLIVIYFMTCAP